MTHGLLSATLSFLSFHSARGWGLTPCQGHVALVAYPAINSGQLLSYGELTHFAPDPAHAPFLNCDHPMSTQNAHSPARTQTCVYTIGALSMQTAHVTLSHPKQTLEQDALVCA